MKASLSHNHATNPLTAVPLQWTPSHAFHGTVLLTATIVSNYTHYWTNVLSVPITVSRPDRDLTQSTSEASQPTERSEEPSGNRERSSTEQSENVLNDSELLELLSQVIKTKTSETDVSVTASNYINYYTDIQSGEEDNIDLSLLNSSMRGRSPRFENQHLYEKIEAEYGAWENRGPAANISHSLLIFSLLVVILHFCHE